MGRYLGLGRYARGEDFPPVVLEFPDVELDQNLPLVAGANTSGFNTCHLQVLDGQGRRLCGSRRSGGRSRTVRTRQRQRSWAEAARRDISFRRVMRPTRAGTPSMALAIHQGSDLDKTQMEMLAEKARFVSDPAQRPDGGHFEVRLFLDSTVKVQIWSGSCGRGSFVSGTVS